MHLKGGFRTREACHSLSRVSGNKSALRAAMKFTLRVDEIPAAAVRKRHVVPHTQLSLA